MLVPFTPGASVSRAASTSSANVALPSTKGNQVLVFAPAGNAAVVFIAFGTGSGTTAAVTDIPIPPGFNRIFTIPNGTTYVAAITAASTGTVYFTCGDGQ